MAKALFVGSSPSRSSWSEAHQIHSSIKGYMFFGTLQRGTIAKDIQGLVKTASRVAGWVSSDKALLGPFLDKIPSINEEFSSLGGTQVPTVCFFEAQKTSLGLYVRLAQLLNSSLLTSAELHTCEPRERHASRCREPIFGCKSFAVVQILK